MAGKPQIFGFFWTVLVPKVTKITLKKFFSKILGPPPGHHKIAIFGHLHRVLPVCLKKIVKNRPPPIFLKLAPLNASHRADFNGMTYAGGSRTPEIELHPP